MPAIADKPRVEADRGYFWYGLESARDQADRAIAFGEYYFDALRNRNLVGAHWFSFAPQPITGRKDGEAAQIGLVDIADHPKPLLPIKFRRVTRQLFRVGYRSLILIYFAGFLMPFSHEKRRY
ncbi:MAG: hypothetical protein AAF357_04285 [Verrucomicrobiota bacterium]